MGANELLSLIRKASKESEEAGQPCDFCYGTVTSEDPDLKILVEQKMELTRAQLVLARDVTDYYIDVTPLEPWTEKKPTDPWVTEYEQGGSGDAEFASHRHKIQGKKKLKIWNHLQVGEKVILIKQRGGQQYLIIDRVEETE